MAGKKSRKVTVSVQVSKSGYLYSYVKHWGHWIGATIDEGPTGRRAMVKNYHTGKTYHRAGDLEYLGDGFALISNDKYQLSVWYFPTGKVSFLGKDTSAFAYPADGNRVAYTNASQLVVRTLPGVATSRPRLLRALTSGKGTRKSPWKAEIDVTKPLSAGALVIRDEAGRVCAA